MKSDEIPPLTATATLEIRDKVRLVLADALDVLARDYKDRVFTPPEVWDAQVDRVGADVVNVALNVAWKDWNNE